MMLDNTWGHDLTSMSQQAAQAMDNPVFMGQPAQPASDQQRRQLGDEVEDMLLNKGRIKWNPELEGLFTAAVDELGGSFSKCISIFLKL